MAGLMNVHHIISALIGARTSIGLAERATHDGDTDRAHHWLDEAELALFEARARLRALDRRAS